MRNMRLSFHVAARPIACGNTVASPERATPCSASFHQLYAGNAEPLDRRRDVLHLRDLLLERHARHEIVRRARRTDSDCILVGWLLRECSCSRQRRALSGSRAHDACLTRSIPWCEVVIELPGDLKRSGYRESIDRSRRVSLAGTQDRRRKCGWLGESGKCCVSSATPAFAAVDDTTLSTCARDATPE